MNPPKIKNPFNTLVNRKVFLPFLSRTQLSIFSCSYEELNKILPIIEAYRGSVGYLNLEGVKDIVMQKQGKYPLIHLQFGPLKSKSNFLPEPGYHYMWCSPSTDPLTQALLEAGYVPSATATIFSFLMKDYDWSWILSSEI